MAWNRTRIPYRSPSDARLLLRTAPGTIRAREGRAGAGPPLLTEHFELWEDR